MVCTAATGTAASASTSAVASSAVAAAAWRVVGMVPRGWTPAGDLRAGGAVAALERLGITVRVATGARAASADALALAQGRRVHAWSGGGKSDREEREECGTDEGGHVGGEEKGDFCFLLPVLPHAQSERRVAGGRVARNWCADPFQHVGCLCVACAWYVLCVVTPAGQTRSHCAQP